MLRVKADLLQRERVIRKVFHFRIVLHPIWVLRVGQNRLVFHRLN
jgi:hypothetical protein